MKRYRVIAIDFDSRALTLNPIQDNWEEHIKELHRKNQDLIIARLKLQFGENNFEAKLANFKELGAKPLSVVAFHNRFLSQSRDAFVFGQYYPALTGACALGERILNHLVIGLRDSYKSHDLYKKVHGKESFDNWPFLINVLSEWEILTPGAIKSFQLLNQKRNNAIHFNLSTEFNDRQHALDAIKNIEEIVSQQFSGFGVLPWLLPSPGECFIKKEFENSPFVRLVYLQSCVFLGYKHIVTSIFPWEFQDAEDYPDEDVSDNEYLRLRQEFQQRKSTT